MKLQIIPEVKIACIRNIILGVYLGHLVGALRATLPLISRVCLAA